MTGGERKEGGNLQKLGRFSRGDDGKDWAATRDIKSAPPSLPGKGHPGESAGIGLQVALMDRIRRVRAEGSEAHRIAGRSALEQGYQELQRGGIPGQEFDQRQPPAAIHFAAGKRGNGGLFARIQFFPGMGRRGEIEGSEKSLDRSEGRISGGGIGHGMGMTRNVDGLAGNKKPDPQ